MSAHRLSHAERPRLALIEPAGQARCRVSLVQAPADRPPGHPPVLLGFSAFCRLIDQSAQLSELQLHGAADPLLHPRLFDMVRYATQRGIDVMAWSSLSLMSGRRAEECVRSGLRGFHVPLEESEPDSYDRQLRNVLRLVSARREMRSRLPEVNLAAGDRTFAVEGPERVESVFAQARDARPRSRMLHS